MKKYLSIIIPSLLLFFSCKEENVINTPELTSTQATQNHLTAESIFNDIERIIEEGLKNNGQGKSCPNYTLINSDTLNIDTLIIEFPQGQCPPTYGKIRSGNIIVTYNGKYREPQSVITCTFDNYYVNNNLIQGEKVITNQGRNNDGNLWFTIDVNNASITTQINGTINWQSNRIREWISGENTYYDITDDKYKITGSAQGNSANGNDFYMEITTPLDVDLGCLPYCIIKSGTAKIVPNGYNERIINYGDSICDCNVDVLINGNTYPIIIGN